ncbi:MAG: hypothetical protein MZV70_65750 [Desulfobacterales bacterium]|nr:hypothetical protein [Desulfobacterales bacterium]
MDQGSPSSAKRVPDRSYQSKTDSSTGSLREQKVAELLEQGKKEQGTFHFMVSQRAAEAARMHCSDMARNDIFSRGGSDGSDGGERLKRVIQLVGLRRDHRLGD